MAGLPPWLQITPSQYLAAVEAGTRAGLSIRQANESAFENAQRMQMDQEAQQQRQQQLGAESVAQRLAADKLDQYRQGELKNAQERNRISDANDMATRTETGRHNLATENAKLTSPPTIHSAGGRLWKLGADGNAIPLTPPPPETVTEESTVPAVEPVEAQPASKGIPLLHWFAHPAIPAVPGALEKKVRRTRKILPDGVTHVYDPATGDYKPADQGEGD